MKQLFSVIINGIFIAGVSWAATLLSVSCAFSMECLDSQVLTTIAPAGADQPSDLDIGPNGDIYLVDGVNNRIIVTRPDGALQFTFGKSGSGPGEFRYPVGIDISKQGRVFIADTGNHRIQVFTLSGTFSYMFPVQAGAGEKPADPVDVLAIELKNYLYVSDNDNHKIRVYTQDGNFQFEWGGFGEVRGRFRYPATLAANEYNQIFVVDVINTRVQEFDPYGNFIAEIGTWGVSPGELFKPKGVAIDTDGRVFVSDSFMGCVQVFTDLGGFDGVVCEKGTKREFVTPVGMVFDNDNRLHVVEMRKNRIRVLKVSK